jgi:predicted transcriptional regulator
MEVRVTPEVEAQLTQLAADTGRSQDAIANDVLATHLAEMIEVRHLLNSRYADITNGRVAGLDGPTVLRQLLAENATQRAKAG